MEEFTFNDILLPSTTLSSSSSSSSLSVVASSLAISIPTTTPTTTTTTTTTTVTTTTTPSLPLTSSIKNLKRQRNTVTSQTTKKKKKKSWWSDFFQVNNDDDDNDNNDDDNNNNNDDDADADDDDDVNVNESNNDDNDKDDKKITKPARGNSVKPSPSCFMLPHETPEQVLERTDLVRKTRKENMQLFNQTVQRFAIGSDEYNTAYREYCEVAQSRALEVFFKGNEELLSAAIVKSRRWFEQLPEQFVEVPMLFNNLTYFGNVMTTFALDMQLIANPGHLFDIVALLNATAACAYAYNEKQSPWLLLAGDASVGKSYLMKQLESTLPPGVVAESMYRSPLVLTSPSNADCQLLLDEEASGVLIGTDNRRAAAAPKSGNTLMKNYLTNKIVISERMLGGRKQRAVTSQMGTGILATNDALPDANHPMLVRYLVLTPEALPGESDESIARKLNKLTTCKHTNEVARSIARERLIQFYMLLVEQLIAMHALRDVNMDAYTIYWSCVSDSLSKCAGFYRLDNTKKLTMIRWLVRSLVVRKAVCTALFSEYFVSNRISNSNSEGNGKYCKFLDNWHVHLRTIDRLLVAEEPEIVFGISMCAPLFANLLEVKLMRLLRDLILADLDRNDNDLSSIAVDSHKFLRLANGTVSYEYIGLLSLSGNHQTTAADVVPSFDVSTLANSLAARMCDGKPPILSIVSALVHLAKTNVTFDRLTTTKAPHDGVASRVLCVDTASPQRITGPIVRMIRVGNNDDVRFYVAVHALLTYHSVAETIKAVLVDNMAHRFQLSATHVVNSQYIGTRTSENDINDNNDNNSNNNQVNSLYRFNGIYDTIRTAANQNRVHEFINHNTVSTSQFEAISKHYSIMSPEEQQRSPTATTRSTSATTSIHQCAAYWVDGAIDSAAFEAHQHTVAATDATLYWFNFQRENNSARQAQSNLFSDANWQYPQQLVAERQSQNAQIDLLRRSTIDTRMSHLPPVSNLVLANVNVSNSPSPPRSLNVDSDVDVDLLSGSF